MNIRNMQRTNYCTQSQQSVASVLIVWLLASCSLDSALAAPERQPTMVPAATTSPGNPFLASTPSTPRGQLPLGSPGSLWGDSVATDAATQWQSTHGLRARTIGKLASRLSRSRPVAEGTEELPVYEDALEIVQNLIDAARDEQWSARKVALKKLMQVVHTTPSKMQDILSELTKAARDPNEAVRLIVLEAFASLAPVASSAAGTILPILTQAANKDQDYDTRLVALEALAKMAIAAPSEASGIMPILEAAAKDQDEDIREIALEALSRVPRAASSEITDTTTVPEDTADQQALYTESLLQLRAAHKPALPCLESEVQQKVMLSAEEPAPQVLLALRRELAELRGELQTQQLARLAEKKSAAELARAEFQEQKAPHTQELAYKELLVDSMKKGSEVQELKSALERAQSEKQDLQRKYEVLLSKLDQLRSAQGKKPGVTSYPLAEDAVAGKKPEVTSSPLSGDLVSDKTQAVPSSVIDASVWQQYFGDVGATPLLPDNIENILNSPCPFWPGRQVRETHLLALIPAQVAGQPLTLDYLGELIKRPRGEGHATKYRYYWDGLREAIGSQASGSSYWVLMTKDVLPESRSKSSAAQCALVERHQGYTVPGALEAAVVMLLHHVRSGDRLYTDNPVTYTHCLDKDTNGWPVIFGDFSSGGLYINYHNYDTSHNVGIAALRKFGALPSLAVIDAAVWQRYFGDVGVAPPLPDGIEETLNSPCPFWEGKQIKDTHLLVLIPSYVAGQPLTLDYLGQLIQQPQGGGHATKYRFYWDSVREAIGSQTSGSSYWVLMTKDVLPESRDKSYMDQYALVAAHAERTGLTYEVPGALEAAVVMLLHHVRSGERLYSDDPSTYTRCWEKVQGFQLIVGGCSSVGFSIYSLSYGYDYVGVAGLRRF